LGADVTDFRFCFGSFFFGRALRLDADFGLDADLGRERGLRFADFLGLGFRFVGFFFAILYWVQLMPDKRTTVSRQIGQKRIC
jgi:hypothetical protein